MYVGLCPGSDDMYLGTNRMRLANYQGQGRSSNEPAIIIYSVFLLLISSSYFFLLLFYIPLQALIAGAGWTFYDGVILNLIGESLCSPLVNHSLQVPTKYKGKLPI